jgi:lipoprotein NlpI
MKRITTRNAFFAGAALAFLVPLAFGSGGCKEPEVGGTGGSGAGGDGPPPIVAQALDDAQKMVTENDAKGWTEEACAKTAEAFKDASAKNEEAAASHEPLYTALYNAGLAYERCKNDAEAKKIFVDILEKKQDFHRARVKVALYNFKESGEKEIDKAIAEIERAIKDAEYKNEEALVNLGILQMRRRNAVKDEDGDSDMDRAKTNLQRALAINDGFMPAFNQLAVYYMQKAREQAGRKDSKVASDVGKKKQVSTQALDMAALVVSQALRRNPKYAPVHNTRGLIARELGDLSGAAKSFKSAREFDPKFFEAHMNYASVNLEFRGFKEAEAGYRAALALRSNDYEAHLGLALALRGKLADPTINYAEVLLEVDKELEAAKAIDPSRPETYYNQAILTQEFKARDAGENNEPVLLKAKELFGEFASKAGKSPDYADAAKRAKERMDEIDQIITFNKQSKADQKRMEEEQKQREAQQQLNPDQNPNPNPDQPPTP